MPGIDPNALPVYPAVANVADLSFANNIYYKAGSAAGNRYVDRRVAPMGYDGALAGWKAYTGSDVGSREADPKLNTYSYKPRSGSPAIKTVPRLKVADKDYNGASRGPLGGLTDAGAVIS